MTATAYPDDVAFVVVGGYEYSPAMNQPATVTVRELARHYRVLNLNSEAHGSVLRRLGGRAPHMGARDVARTVLGSTRPRRVEERLWLAPVRGLAAIGPLSVPEVVRQRNVKVFTRVIRGWMRDMNVERCVLLFYWWALPELVHTIPHLASIYDCTDEQSALPGALVPAGVVSRLEGQLLDAVTQSFVVSPALLERRAGQGRQISVLPNAFDLAFFAELEHRGFEVPAPLRSIPGPIIGYAGGLTARMDWELVEELSRRRPQWNFVFVGGDPRVAPHELRHRANVFFHGVVPYPQALGAISRFHVGIIPARVQRFSRGNSFLKLLDYFAHGIPVVAPPLPDTIHIAEDGPGLLRLAGDVESWDAALAACIDESSGSPLRQARRAYVEARSVEHRVSHMVEEALSRGNGSQLTDAPAPRAGDGPVVVQRGRTTDRSV